MKLSSTRSPNTKFGKKTELVKTRTSKRQKETLLRDESIADLHLDQLQRPKTLLIVYYKDKRLSIPIFSKCQNSQIFIRSNLQKFQRQIFGKTSRKKQTSLDQIISFRTTDHDILKDYYLSSGKDISIFKILEVQPMWSVPQLRGFSNYEIQRCIGYGGFSKVYLARRITDGRFCALKVIEKSAIYNDNRLEMVRTEDKILRLVDHPFVVKMLASFETSKYVVFVLDHCQGGQLFFQLKKIKKMSEQEAKYYFSQILLAFEYLHSKNILYRDIKPENIMMDADGHLLLGDFGLAKVGLQPRQKTYSFCGSHEYMAPQMLEEEGHDYLLDCYCLGALLYQFVVGFPPFYNPDREKIMWSIRNEEVQFPQPTDISIKLKELIGNLLKKSSSERLGNGGIKEIMQHQWLESVNFQMILQKRIAPPLKPSLLQWNFDEKDIKNQGINNDVRELYTNPEIDKEILHEDNEQEDESLLPKFMKPKHGKSKDSSKSKKHNKSKNCSKNKSPSRDTKKSPSCSSNLNRKSSSHTFHRITSNSKLNVNISIRRQVEIGGPNLKRIRSSQHKLNKSRNKNRRKPI